MIEEINKAQEYIENKIKSAQEFGIGVGPVYETILKALSAYEKLQGVDLEELADAVQILETWDTSRDGYIKPNYFPMRDVLNAARLVADIGKETKNDE